MALPSITDMDVAGRRLVVRADLAVPPDEGGAAGDASRIIRFAEGMKPLLEAGAALVILAHPGRPGGQRVEALSTERLAAPLRRALGARVRFCHQPAGNGAEAMAEALRPGEALLCENIGFEPGEEKNDPALAARLARLGDLYVNDAFACAHRKLASTVGIARMLPAFAGPLLAAEIAALTATLDAPARPAAGIVGGARLSAKAALVKNLARKMDMLIIGGGIANSFLFADGAPMGRSLHEPDQVENVREIRAIAARSGCEILLPTDVVVARELRPHARKQICAADACPEDALILDAGPASLRRFQTALAEAHAILWQGPIGAIETPPFDHSTKLLAACTAELAREGCAVAVAGGRDTALALDLAGVTQDFTHVSSAEDAFLEWLEGKPLPAIGALMRTTKAA